MRARRQMRARQERHGRPSLPLSWSTAFPPVVWWLLPDHRRRNFHREVVAELPQLLRRPGVLEENLIDVEGVNRAGTIPIDGLPNARDKVAQLRLVVLRDHGARCSSLRLAGHEYEATQSAASQRHYRMGRADCGRGGWPPRACADGRLAWRRGRTARGNGGRSRPECESPASAAHLPVKALRMAPRALDGRFGR